METLALVVRLEARSGKEREIEHLFETLRENQAGYTWYALRSGPSSFTMVAVFSDESDRAALLTGSFAQSLLLRGSELLVEAPRIELADIVAVSAGQK